MLADLASVSNADRWHIDHINTAPTSAEALRRADEWVRSKLRDCQLRRPQDAEGFRWQIIHLLASFAVQIPSSRPADEFRSAPLHLPGGGWVAKPGSSVRHP